MTTTTATSRATGVHARVPPSHVSAASSVDSSTASRKHTACALPFPDDDHAPRPSRRAQFVRVTRNGLPPAPAHARQTQPEAHAAGASVDRTHRSSRRKAPRRIANPCESDLWGFPVYFSPTQAIQTQWQHVRAAAAAAATPTEISTTHGHDHDHDASLARDTRQATSRLQHEHALAPVRATTVSSSSSSRQSNTSSTDRSSDACCATDRACTATTEASFAVCDRPLHRRQQQQRQADRAQYVHLALKYGPLDARLYCCAPLPGRVYALVVDHSARTLQRWAKQRVCALRRFWVVHLASELSALSLASGAQRVAASRSQQQRLAAFARQLQWRLAAAALRCWAAQTQQQIEVAWRFRCALREDVRARFGHWRARAAAARDFRQQLHRVVRRKRMARVFAHWQRWCRRRRGTRQLLKRQWTQTQQRCFAAWRARIQTAKRAVRAAATLQRAWRSAQQRRVARQRQLAGALLVRTTRDWLARRRVLELRGAMAVAATLLQLTRVVAWRAQRARLQRTRARLLARETARAEQEAALAASAAVDAAALVRAELAKVVRNATHARLQHMLTQLREANECARAAADRAAVPGVAGAARGASGRGRDGHLRQLIETATAALVAQAQHDARVRAIAAFRAQTREHLPLDGCFVCLAAATEATRSGQDGVWGCGDSRDRVATAMDERGERPGAPDASDDAVVVHECSRFTGADHAAIGQSLDALCAREAAWANDALRCETVPTPALWRVLRLGALAQHWCV